MIIPSAIERRDLFAYYLIFCNKQIDAVYNEFSELNQPALFGGIPCTIYTCEVKDAPSPLDVEFQFYLKKSPNEKHKGYIFNFDIKVSDLEMIIKERDEHVHRMQRFMS